MKAIISIREQEEDHPRAVRFRVLVPVPRASARPLAPGRPQVVDARVPEQRQPGPGPAGHSGGGHQQVYVKL